MKKTVLLLAIILLPAIIVLSNFLLKLDSVNSGRVDSNIDQFIPEYKIEYCAVAKQYTAEVTAYWYMDPIDASGTGLTFLGTPAIPWEVCAVDPQLIPLNSKIRIHGLRNIVNRELPNYFRAEDTGNLIKTKVTESGLITSIDIAVESKEAAIKFGRRLLNITVIEPPRIVLYTPKDGKLVGERGYVAYE